MARVTIPNFDKLVFVDFGENFFCWIKITVLEVLVGSIGVIPTLHIGELS